MATTLFLNTATQFSSNIGARGSEGVASHPPAGIDHSTVNKFLSPMITDSTNQAIGRAATQGQSSAGPAAAATTTAPAPAPAPPAPPAELATTDPTKWTESQGATAVVDNFDLIADGNGDVTMDNAKAIVNNTTDPSKLTGNDLKRYNVASYLAKNPELFDKIDSASADQLHGRDGAFPGLGLGASSILGGMGGLGAMLARLHGKNGKITKEDAQAFQSKQPITPEQTHTLDTLLAYKPVNDDSSLSVADVQKMASDTTLPQYVQKAARDLLNDKPFLRRLDTASQLKHARLHHLFGLIIPAGTPKADQIMSGDDFATVRNSDSYKAAQQQWAAAHPQAV